METGNVNSTTQSDKISVPRKHLKDRRIEAKSVPDRLFNNGGDIMKKYVRNFKNIKFENISGEYGAKNLVEEPAPLAIDPNANKQAMEVADYCRLDAEAKNMVEESAPLAIDPNALVGDEEVPEDTYAQLEAKIKKLKKENSMSCQKMQEISVSCGQLRKENHSLLKRLKKVCTPDTIAYLEARNPDKRVDNLGSPQ